jgi:diguanylate cyclase (GGDEF)-like protein/PAS domain S-box-containing protein
MHSSYAPNEPERLRSLGHLKILDTGAEQAFDDIVRLAAQICGMPQAALAFVDADRIWYKSKIGIKLDEIPRETSFCSQTMHVSDLLIVKNAAIDKRFAQNTLVLDSHQVRFYAGVPITTEEGIAIGSLCVSDRVERRLSKEQKDALRALARQVMKLLSLRIRAEEMVRSNDDLHYEIEERRKIERVLRLRDQAMANISEGILITEKRGSNHVIIYANKAFEDLTGFTFEEIREKNCRFLQGPDTDPATTELLKRSIAAEEPCQTQILNYRKDGTPFWNSLSITPVKDASGVTTHFVGVQRDITRRREADEKLRQSEERYRFLSESLPQHVWTALPDGTLDYCNLRTTEFYGRKTAADVLAMAWDEILHPDDVPYAARLWTRSIKTGQPYEAEYRLARWDGEYRWHLAQACAMKDPGGNIVKWFGTNTDIHARKMAEKEARETVGYRNLFQNANDAILVFEPDTEIVIDVNDKACEMYGYKRDEFIGKSIKEMSADVARGELQLRQLRILGTNQSFETVQYRSDGTPLDIFINSSIIKYGGKKVVLSINRDVTEQKKTQIELEKSQERYRQLFDSNPHPTWVYDTETLKILAVNEKAIAHYGYSREEFFNLSSRDLRPEEDVPDFLEEVERSRVFFTHITRVSRHKIKDGAIIDVEVDSEPIVFNGRHARLVLATDITVRKRAEEQLRHNALHDGLTGLPNRSLFLEHLRQTIELSAKRKRNPFAVLFLDLDHFKVINDSLGHLEGDNLLRLFAQRLRDCLRPGDVVARLGGDEFTILLNELADFGDVMQIVERIQAELKFPFDLNGSEVFTTASIGIALGNQNYTRPDDMLRDADIAMYRAKEAGKARHYIFHPAMHEQAHSRLRLEIELRRALTDKEFCLYFQPIVKMETGEITGFESLSRWQHPVRGLVGPREFISIAEETGMIIPLGEWGLRESCRRLREWQDEYPEAAQLSMSVNLSPKQFNQKDLVERVIDILNETKIEPGCLRLEITESLLMEDSETTIEKMNRLSAAGIKLAIDDFGTGYSSLSYLHRLPVDYLKIDRSFVSQMQANKQNREIVKTIVLLSKNLNLEVVAEGIETAEQAEYLKGLGCNYGQGYLFSRPVDAEKARRLLGHNVADTGFCDLAPVPELSNELAH